MSSGTQVDLDWAGIDAAQNGAGVSLALTQEGFAPKNEGPAMSTNDATGTAHLTDEEILGIADGVEVPQRDSSGKTRPRNDKGEGAVDASVQTDGSTSAQNPGSEDPSYSRAITADMPAWMAAAAGDPQHGGEAQALWREHQEFRAAFASPEEARAVKELLPGGVRDVLSLREATQSVERIDAAIFSGDARAQADVVAELARANPAAFRSLFAEAAKVVAGLGTSRTGFSLSPFGNDSGAGSGEAGSTEGRSFRSSSSVILSEAKNLFDGLADGGRNPRRDSSGQNRPQNDSAAEGSRNFQGGAAESLPAIRASESQATNHESRTTNHAFDPAAYAAFERATNDAVARDVRGSIHDTLARVLPEGVAEGAARRIGEDIFQEVHRALAADRSLSEQVAGVLSERRFGGAEQQRIASLLAGRARQIVPGVARRVIGEWTSTVLNTARSKAARQATAASRVDIAAPGGSRDSMPLRQMSPREVNYASMSDEEILGI